MKGGASAAHCYSSPLRLRLQPSPLRFWANGNGGSRQEHCAPAATCARGDAVAGRPLWWRPAQIRPSWPKASGGKGVARPKPSSAGEGAASPRPANLGSGREPTRVGSDPDSACAARGAMGCMGVAGLKPSDAGEGAASPPPGRRPGAHSGGVRPRFSLRCRRRARLQRRRRAEAERLRGRCSPSCRAKPGSGWEPTRVGSSPDSACAAGGAP